MTAAEQQLTIEQQAEQRVARRQTWETARRRAEALHGRTDRQAILDLLHDDARQLDVGRWFATLPACGQHDGCVYPGTTDPWEAPPTHDEACVRGQAIAARWGRL